MIGRDTDVRGSLLEHLEHGVEDADDGTEGCILALVEATQAVEVPEQFVGAVDEMNDHAQALV